MDSSQGNNRLLILDDEPSILSSLVRILLREGYEIDTFDRPLDAVESLKKKPFGVLITDQCMPQMEGDEFLAIARELQPQALSIVITGFSKKAFEELNAAPVAAWRCFAKPWDDDEMLETVAEAFEIYRGRLES